MQTTSGFRDSSQVVNTEGCRIPSDRTRMLIRARLWSYDKLFNVVCSILLHMSYRPLIFLYDPLTYANHEIHDLGHLGPATYTNIHVHECSNPWLHDPWVELTHCIHHRRLRWPMAALIHDFPRLITYVTHGLYNHDLFLPWTKWPMTSVTIPSCFREFHKQTIYVNSLSHSFHDP